jgi:hypothetical protein
LSAIVAVVTVVTVLAALLPLILSVLVLAAETAFPSPGFPVGRMMRLIQSIIHFVLPCLYYPVWTLASAGFHRWPVDPVRGLNLLRLIGWYSAQKKFVKSSVSISA